ncbi:MAG: DUF2726 domain-containing protein [Candidatus Omnitrophica bacterium]|nr:DUF2726 domain-containing protein [Candidatus Omnitrophota bacterium]
MKNIIIFFFIIFILIKLNDRFGWFKIPAIKEKKLDYRKNKYFLTDTEKSFYFVLKQIADRNNLIIFSKVRLIDLFFVPGRDASARARIIQKHVDFVLCEYSHLDPICCIELDDYSHKFKKRKERDVFVNKVFESAGLPLLRVKVSSNYDVQSLEENIIQSQQKIRNLSR